MNITVTFSIGEVSRRTGLTERALRLYEQQGLVSPARTQGGRRFYKTVDLARLQQVQVLRRAGYSLEKIGIIVRTRNFNTTSMIDLHLRALKDERDRLNRQIESVEAARSEIKGDDEVSPATLCDLIRLGERSIEEAGWKKVAERYWTADECERWKNATEKIFTEAYQQSWGDLVSSVNGALKKGTSPDSAEAIELARRWINLQTPLVDATPDLWHKSIRVYQEMDQWSHFATPPFSKDVYSFVAEAARIGRDRGLIPPPD